MRNRFDHLAKQIGQEALSRSGVTVAHDPINPETQYADLRHEPDPARQAERNRMGLLGRLASEPCLLEVYSHAPDAGEFRACLSKHLASWQGRARKARSDHRERSEQGQALDAFVDPFLWIIAAGAPTKLLTKLKLEAAADWPAGVYLFGGDILRVGLVVASELRRDASTLLVRLMAAGPLLTQAIREIATLPADAYELAVTEPVLLRVVPQGRREIVLVGHVGSRPCPVWRGLAEASLIQGWARCHANSSPSHHDKVGCGRPPREAGALTSREVV